MNLIHATIERRRLILAAVGVLSIIGLLAWLGMNRQEDPFFPYRYGHVLVSWPGADTERVERLVLNIVEEELAGVDEINDIRGTARLGFAHMVVGMQQHVYDTDAVWQQVRSALERAERKLPDGAGPIELRDRSMDTHGIVLALTGSDDLLTLLDAARQLRRDLFSVPDIGRIDLLGDPGEQISLSLDTARLQDLGLSTTELARQLDAANQVLPGGTLRSGDRNLVLQARSDLVALEELAALTVRTPSGDLLPLGEIAGIRLHPAEPATERIWHAGQPAVALGIVIPENRLNAVHFGRQLRARLDQVRPDYAPLAIEEMFYQPAWVESRLAELGRSLLLGVVIVAAVLLAFMGLRMGLIVAGLLPIVTLSALAVYAMGGGVLHQMAVAGLVIALGMLVDNAIVMVENLQWHLDRGKQPAPAASASVRELAGPLAAATGTTLAAFTPLLLSPGDTGDFTRGIPILVMLTLSVSYLYAVFVTPTMASALLKPGSSRRGAPIERLGRRLGHLAIHSPQWILLAAGLLLLGAVGLSGQLQRDFFPSTDRNQLIVDLNFSEGTRLESTALQASRVAGELRELANVQTVHHFAGFSGPRFYYNLIETPRAPHLARLVAITNSDSDLPGIMAWVRRHVPAIVPEAEVVARRLGQGPPIDAPIEIRLFGSEPEALASASRQVMALLRNTPGAEDVRHRLGDGLPTLEFTINDAEAARFGISRRHIGQALADATLGRHASTWRAGRQPLPMRIRSPEGEQLPERALEGLLIETERGPVPLSQFVHTRLVFLPAVIEHRDLKRMTAVLAETSEGVTYSRVLERVQPELERLDLPPGVRLELGGAAAEADSANSALFQSLPIGVLLLLVFLLWQFNSFRLVGLVLLTVPLGAVGVVPGLILAGQPFSFTAMLGVVALIGIVVNNAIVLIDVIESGRREGLNLDQAVMAAVGRRTRPILLTTATTIAGLLPLTFTQSTLWPPMAWAIISGLLASTLLTLLVIPAVYRLIYRVRNPSSAST